MQAFDEQPHLQLLKELLTQTFATPRRHHKSKPFCDHVLAFGVADSRVWLRNYQARGWLGLTCGAVWHGMTSSDPPQVLSTAVQDQFCGWSQLMSTMVCSPGIHRTL